MGKYVHPAEKVMKKDRMIDSSSRFRERGKKRATRTLTYITTRLPLCTAWAQGDLRIFQS